MKKNNDSCDSENSISAGAIKSISFIEINPKEKKAELDNEDEKGITVTEEVDVFGINGEFIGTFERPTTLKKLFGK